MSVSPCYFAYLDIENEIAMCLICGLGEEMASPIGPVVLAADENARAFAQSVAPAASSSRNPPLHATAEMRRLATPWAVAAARARLLADCKLSPGVILDPACGSATQLVALCCELEAAGIGVELDGAAAPLAAVNLARCAEWTDEDDDGAGAWGSSSRVLWGNGLDADGVMEAYRASTGEEDFRISLFHVDPERPVDAQRHTLDEMQPRLDLLLKAWAPYLSVDGEIPALILDLSPRLSNQQRSEIEDIIDSLWPKAARTWQWLTQGRGRIDRLSLWVGPVASTSPTRLVRLRKDGHLVTLKGDTTDTEESVNAEVSIGDWVTLVDPALLGSGLASEWLDTAIAPDSKREWLRCEGRRPLLLTDTQLEEDEIAAAFCSISGEVVCLAFTDWHIVDQDAIAATAQGLAEEAIDAGLTSLHLRCSMNPELQPKMQSAIDRAIRRLNTESDDESRGFLVETDSVPLQHLLCRIP